MLHRLGLILPFLLMSTPVRAQSQDDVFIGSHIEVLIGEGKYKEAMEFIKAGIEKNVVQKVFSAAYYAGAGKFYMETGNIRETGEALKAAETISANLGIGGDITARERAA
jgi:hypothetical protein